MARMSDLARYDDPLYPEDAIDPRVRRRTLVEAARETIEGPPQASDPAPYERRSMSDLVPGESDTRTQTRRTARTEPSSSPYTEANPYPRAGTTTPAETTTTSAPWQMPTLASGSSTSRNAPRLVQRNGQWVLTEHGNERPLQASEVADAQKYVDDFWQRYPSGFQPGVGPQTNAEYDSAPKTSTTTAGSTGNTGTGGNYTYTGFNTQRAQDPTKSAKDAFLAAAKEAEATGVGDIWKTKAGAQLFAERYVKAKLEEYGFKVLEIIGDKMRVVTREDAEAGNTAGSWIDFVVNADGDNPALAWQSEMTREAFGTLDPYVPTPGSTTTTPTTTPTATTTPTPTTVPVNTALPSPDGTAPGPSATTGEIDPYAYNLLARPMSELAR